jgi:hypothetical protein
MTLAEFQQWLNAHGARNAAGRLIGVDGLRGGETRAAILSTFANRRAAAVTGQDIARCAGRIGCTMKQVHAVATVESAGGGYQDDGLPKALYERHYFWKRIKINIPLLSDPTPGGYTTDADRDGINDNWEKIADAAMRNPIGGFESASFGKFQIMGAWAVKMGYANAIEFVYALSRSEAAHYDALVRFIDMAGLAPAMRRLSTNPADCLAFARGYNGKKQKGYDSRLAEAMR